MGDLNPCKEVSSDSAKTTPDVVSIIGFGWTLASKGLVLADVWIAAFDTGRLSWLCPCWQSGQLVPVRA